MPKAMVTASSEWSRSGSAKPSAPTSRGAHPLLPWRSAARSSMPRLTSAPMTRRPGRRRPGSETPLPVHRSSTAWALSGTPRHIATRQAWSWPRVMIRLSRS